MTIAGIVAVCGLILGVIVFIWDIFKRMSDGPKLKVTVTSNMRAIGDPSRENIDFTSITVTNVGSRPTTVNSVGAYGYSNRFSFYRNKVGQSVVFPDPNSKYPLPHVLESGLEWIGLVQTEEFFEYMKIKKNNYLVIWLSHSHNKTIRKKLIIPSENLPNS